MLVSYEEFSRRAAGVRAAIAQACAAAGRPPAEVTLLPVTKSHPVAAVEYAARYGLTAVGENRVQEGVEKRGQTTASVRWELIGHLQSNKSALAVRTFDRVQSVDSEKLLTLLNRAAGESGKTPGRTRPSSALSPPRRARSWPRPWPSRTCGSRAS
jgi:hypothetical protein